jgi:hypothetical protein
MRSTIDAVIARHKISRTEFFGPRQFEYLVEARRDAVLRLKELGFPDSQIARELRRDRKAIRNYYQPRGNRRAAARADGLMERLAPDLAAVVVGVAKAEEVTVDELLVRWIADRAEGEAHHKLSQEAAR